MKSVIFITFILFIFFVSNVWLNFKRLPKTKSDAMLGRIYLNYMFNGKEVNTNQCLVRKLAYVKGLYVRSRINMTSVNCFLGALKV